MEEQITLDYGSGGRKTSELIETLLVPAFADPALSQLGDGAVLEDGLVCSTDSFVVAPYFFPGGDIGKLAVCGTVNDVCMCGAEPRALTLALILEEGFPTADLRRIVDSIARTAKAAGVRIVTGDTKVVERGHGDGIYINTTGIGTLRHPGLGREAIRPGDAVLLSGTAGDHGAAIMLARDGLPGAEQVKSDCRCLRELAAAALECGGVRILRDPTRGGVATTLNEFVEGMPFGIELSSVPVRPMVQTACDLLGLDPLYCANEGKMLVVCDPASAPDILAALRRTEGGEEAAQIGFVTEELPGRVVCRTAFGARRILQKLSGAQLPRIC